MTILALALSACWRGASPPLDRSPLPASPGTSGSNSGAVPSAVSTATTTPTPRPTLTPTPPPTPTPSPAELSTAAQQALHDGDYGTAVEAFGVLLSRPLDDVGRAHALLGLGRAHLGDEAYWEAVQALQDLLVEYPESDQARDAQFLLGDALIGAGEPLSATQAYSSYLRSGTVITPYLNLSLADAYRAGGNYAAALSPYQRAIAEAPNRSFEAGAREELASTHIARQDYAAAVEQYDAILDMARQPGYRASIAYRAADTLLLAGDVEAGYARHAEVVRSYPTDEHAYRSLVKLVQAGRPVDDFLRGKVDYYGEAYGPAVEALYRYIRAYPETHSGDAHWYAGLSFYEAGSFELAVNEFQLLIDTHPESPRWGEAWLKLAELRADEGQSAAAVSTYRAFVNAAPDHSLASEALWEAGRVSERVGDLETAAAAYLDCQRLYPTAEFAAAALFRGGLQLYRTGGVAAAAEAWESLDTLYPTSEYHQPALLWLGKVRLEEGETEAAATALEAAAEAAPDAYYGLRAAQLASGSEPFSPRSSGGIAPVGGDERTEAEAWLADWLELESSEGIGELSPQLAADGRLQRGMELWRLDRFQQAKAELEALRAATYSDPLDQYQLALAYGDLGLYRSSILCAWRLVGLSPVTNTLDAPRFLLELAYPTYYQNLVLENADRTGLDPQLIYSLIRQESLFESLATSIASASGLMQVIPPTGAEIAADLDWPPNYTTEDLYRPYVSLRFGTHYLAKQRDRFDGRIDVALAAYNGGPFNAQRWLERSGEDRDLFLEQITFGETRLYVKRIQEHFAVYEALYGD